MPHTEIIVQGTVNNPDISKVIAYQAGFNSLGTTDAHECTPEAITHGVDPADGTTVRASAFASLLTSGGSAFTQADTTHQAEYLPGGGPNGLCDALRFRRTRNDGMAYQGAGPTGEHTVISVIKIDGSNMSIGDNGLLFSTSNNATTGRSVMYIRKQSSSVYALVGYVGQATPTLGDASSTLNVPAAPWIGVLRCWRPSDRKLVVGYYINGAFVWGPVDTGESGTAITQTARQFGSSAGFNSDSFDGWWCANRVVPHFIQDDGDALDIVGAYLGGDDSRFEL